MGQSRDALDQSGTADESSAPDVTPETEHLRQDIAHTRTDMSDTLDAIQQRLNPETLGERAKDTASDITTQAKEAALEVLDHALSEAKEQAREILVDARVAARAAVEEVTAGAKAAVRGATIGKVETMIRSANETTNAARYGLMDTIKANPFPAALAGIGLSWLFINSRSAAARGSMAPRTYEAEHQERRSYPTGAPSAYGDEWRYRDGYGERGGDAPGGRNPLGSAIDRAQATTGQAASRAGDAIGGAVDQVGETAGNIAGQVSETAGNISDQVGEAAGNLASGTMEAAGTIAEEAQYQALRLEDNFQRVLRENPLAVGAVTLALGTAIGLVLPQTARENRLMGEARGTLVERAQGLAQETIEKIGHVAEEAQDTVQKEAKSQGLT